MEKYNEYCFPCNTCTTRILGRIVSFRIYDACQKIQEMIPKFQLRPMATQQVDYIFLALCQSISKQLTVLNLRICDEFRRYNWPENHEFLYVGILLVK